MENTISEQIGYFGPSFQGDSLAKMKAKKPVVKKQTRLARIAELEAQLERATTDLKLANSQLAVASSRNAQMQESNRRLKLVHDADEDAYREAMKECEKKESELGKEINHLYNSINTRYEECKRLETVATIFASLLIARDDLGIQETIRAFNEACKVTDMDSRSHTEECERVVTEAFAMNVQIAFKYGVGEGDLNFTPNDFLEFARTRLQEAMADAVKDEK